MSLLPDSALMYDVGQAADSPWLSPLYGGNQTGVCLTFFEKGTYFIEQLVKLLVGLCGGKVQRSCLIDIDEELMGRVHFHKGTIVHAALCLCCCVRWVPHAVAVVQGHATVERERSEVRGLDFGEAWLHEAERYLG